MPEESEGAAGEDAAATVDGVTVEERGGLALGRRGVDMGVDMVSQGSRWTPGTADYNYQTDQVGGIGNPAFFLEVPH